MTDYSSEPEDLVHNPTKRTPRKLSDAIHEQAIADMQLSREGKELVPRKCKCKCKGKRERERRIRQGLTKSSIKLAVNKISDIDIYCNILWTNNGDKV